jgi:hypothetical protein
MHSYLVDYEGKVIGCYSNFTSAESFILSCLQNKFMKEFALIHTIRENSCFRIKTKKVTLDKSYKKEMLNKTCKLNGFNCKNTFSNSESDIMSSSLSYESSTEIITSESDKNSSSCTNSISSPQKESSILDIKSEPFVVSNKQTIQIDYSNPVILEMAKQKIDLQHKINILKKQKEKIEESKNVYENDLKLYKIFKQSKESDVNFKVPELFIKKYEIMEKLNCDNILSWENFIKNYQHDNYYGDYFSSNSYEDMFVNNSDSTNDNNSDDSIDEEFNINTESD